MQLDFSPFFCHSETSATGTKVRTGLIWMSSWATKLRGRIWPRIQIKLNDSWLASTDRVHIMQIMKKLIHKTLEPLLPGNVPRGYTESVVAVGCEGNPVLVYCWYWPGFSAFPQSTESDQRPDKKFRPGFIGSPAAAAGWENKEQVPRLARSLSWFLIWGEGRGVSRGQAGGVI